MKKTLFFLATILFFGSSFAQTEIPNTISTTDKIYGLSKFWNLVNYNFVYLNKIDKKQWEEDYKKFIEEVQKTKNDYEYYLVLQKFVALLKDGHTNIFLPGSFSKFMLNGEFSDYKFAMKNIEDRAIITKVNKSKKREIPVGTEIIKVNNLPTKEYIEKYISPYIASSTEHFIKVYAVSSMFYQPMGTTFDLTFKKPNGKIFSKKLTISTAKEKEMYPNKKKEGIFAFKWLKNKTAYVALNSFESYKVDSLFKSKLPELKKAKRLVIDLRKNLGGSSDHAFSILRNLMHDNKIAYSKSLILDYNPLFNYYGTQFNLKAKDTIQGTPENIRLLSRAYLTARDSYFYKIPYYPLDNNLKKEDRVVVPTAILIGPYTASSSEDFLVGTENQKHMIKIGEPTSGSTGMNLPFQLPGGGWARICIKKDVYPNGKEFVGYGIQPDILVKKTYKDYLKDRDPVLERALSYLSKK